MPNSPILKALPFSSEAAITVNGTSLTDAQVMTVRVALGNFVTYLSMNNSLSSDESGRRVARGYQERAHEIFRLMGIME
jgi:hypothetical protein